jgi:CubicO group peptidase (beta-lactamase class C family)
VINKSNKLLTRRHVQGVRCGNQNTGVCGCCSVLRQRHVGGNNKSQAVRPGRVAFQGVVKTTAKELRLPGAMVLLRTPQGEFAFGYDATELGDTIPPRANTHFRAASNTKTMTAAVIVLLVQEGKLRFDDPGSKYVQGVPNGDKITISELLKMRSGLYNYTSAPELAKSLDHDSTRVWIPEELLAVAFKRPPLFAPGKEYDYCNTNYVLLGLIAEKLEGALLAKIFQDRLFGPLGIKHTLLPASTSNTIPEPYSHGYLYGSSSYALVDAPYPADLQAAAEAGTLKPNDDTWQNPSYAFAAGVPSRPPLTSPSGCAGWSEASFSMSTISANGSTALNRRTQANLSVRNMGTGSPRSSLGRTACIFTAVRCPATSHSWVTIQSMM